MEHLNFNANYNGKLWLKYFTTIRSADTIEEKKLAIGSLVEIQKDHLTLFLAEVIQMETIDLDNLTPSQETILMLDVGCHPTQAADTIKHIYHSNKVVIITLRKV